MIPHALNTLIETERLTLQPLKPGDANALLAIFSNTQVMKYWNTPPWTSLNDAIDFINQSEADMRDQQSLTLGIYLKDTGQLLGKCLLFSYSQQSRRAEIGFGLGHEYWGKGYITEAGRALIDYSFTTLGLRRIEAEIDPDNAGSAKALEKLGFVREGLLRQRWEINGVVSDSALYGLLAQGWCEGTSA